MDLGAGRLAVSPLPRMRALRALREVPCTHVVTLLSEREGARSIEAAVLAAGMEWLWLPFENGKPAPRSRDEDVRAMFACIRSHLDQNASILIHCSAGIHRTGMITYALMRHVGLSADAARARLRTMRDITAEHVGDHRLAWGDRFSTI